MRLRAMVHRSTGNTKQAIGGLKGDCVEAREELPMPAYVEIVDEDNGFYLHHYNSDGSSFADTWHQTLVEAKEQAEFEFGITGNQWQSIDMA